MSDWYSEASDLKRLTRILRVVMSFLERKKMLYLIDNDAVSWWLNEKPKIEKEKLTLQ